MAQFKRNASSNLWQDFSNHFMSLIRLGRRVSPKFQPRRVLTETSSNLDLLLIKVISLFIIISKGSMLHKRGVPFLLKQV